VGTPASSNSIVSVCGSAFCAAHDPARDGVELAWAQTRAGARTTFEAPRHVVAFARSVVRQLVHEVAVTGIAGYDQRAATRLMRRLVDERSKGAVRGERQRRVSRDVLLGRIMAKHAVLIEDQLHRGEVLSARAACGPSLTTRARATPRVSAAFLTPARPATASCMAGSTRGAGMTSGARASRRTRLAGLPGCTGLPGCPRASTRRSGATRIGVARSAPIHAAPTAAASCRHAGALAGCALLACFTGRACVLLGARAAASGSD
jgi:hypothetical protein